MSCIVARRSGFIVWIDRILSIHTMNPDRLATMQDIKSSMGIAN